MSNTSTGYQGSCLGDSLAAGRQQYPQDVAVAYSQTVANLRTVILNPSNEIVQRRAAFTALERSSEEGAKAVLDEFRALRLTLEEPAVVGPKSPKHPDHTTGATKQ